MRIFPQRRRDQGGGSSGQSAEAPKPPAKTCPKCKAPMAAGQDWCVQCGTNPSRSMRVRASWYSAGALTALSAILASGAAAAGVAALTEGSTKEPPHPALALQSPTSTTPSAPPATAQSTPPRTPPATSAPVNPGTPETLKLPRRAGTRVLLTRSSTTTRTTSTRSETTTSSQTSTRTGRSQTSTSESTSISGEPLELRGSELSDYDPHSAYPASAVNNPRLAFEEAESVLWAVTIEPGGAHKVGVGLLVGLKEAIRVGAVEVRTQTPGFTVEVMGAAKAPVPGKIGSKRWIKLGKAKSIKATETFQVKKRKPMRYVLLWVKSVPSAIAGTAAEPGHLKLEEVLIFPAS